MYFGGQGILDTAQTSVTPYAFIGGYGYDAIMAGVGASVQTEALLPMGTGLGVGFVDADFQTWFLGLNAQKQHDLTTWSTVLLQGAVAYQRKLEDQNHYHAVYLNPAEWPETPQDLVLFENLSWYTAYIHAVFEAKWKFVEPLVDIGWLGAFYHYSGYECDYDCFDPGETTSGDGTVSGVTFGVGLSLDIGVLQIFGGIRGSEAGTILPVSVTMKF